jgi:hypothetical protein
MKGIFTAVAFSAGVLMGGAAQAQAQNENGPVIKFEQTMMDYGTIDKGADGKRVFIFKNTGKEPLIISNARGSCGCTVPKWPNQPIAPGQSGQIEVVYDTKRVGPFTKTVTVNSNATEPTVVLTIKGTVNTPPAQPTVPAKKEGSSVMNK